MRKGEPIAGLGGLLLLIAAPLDSDLLHFLLLPFGVLALAVPIVSAASSGPAKAIGAAVLASAFGWIGVILAALSGDWLAIAGALIAWVGSWLSLRDESTPGAVAPDVPRLKTPSA